MRKAMPKRPPLLTKPRKTHCPKLFTLTAMCKARAESQVLLTIGASSRLAPILEKNRIDNSRGRTRSISRGAGDVEGGGIVQTPQMCADMVTGGIPP